MLKVFMRLGMINISLLLVASIVIGVAVGHWMPGAGLWLGGFVDPTLLALIVLLFFGVRFEAVVRAFGHWRFLAVALCANFLLVPLIGYAIASVILAAHPLFIVGLMIYFMSPCTDWFLGFTRLAGGNVALGTALIPINMVVQLLLYPLYLHLFGSHLVAVETSLISATLLQWFLLPLAFAVGLHYALRGLAGKVRFERVLGWADHAAPWLIALLVLEIFAGNIAVILEHRSAFGWLLLGVFLFFIATFLLGESVSRAVRFAYPEHALLTMTLAARNAPLMLAVTMAALPGQPLIYAAIVIGMLLEFPHLTLLRHLLLRRKAGPSGFGIPQPTGVS